MEISETEMDAIHELWFTSGYKAGVKDGNEERIQELEKMLDSAITLLASKVRTGDGRRTVDDEVMAWIEEAKAVRDGNVS